MNCIECFNNSMIKNEKKNIKLQCIDLAHIKIMEQFCSNLNKIFLKILLLRLMHIIVDLEITIADSKL